MENASTILQPTTEVPQRNHRHGRRHITGPVVLIVVGLIFLGQNVGMLPANTWLGLWQFWPVLLILAGIELVFGYSGIGSAVVSLLMVITILGLVGTLAFAGQFGGWSASGNYFGTTGSVATNHVNQELGNARRGIIDLEHGGGKLDVMALPQESPQLLDGDLSYSQNSAIERTAESRGDGTYVRLGARNSWKGFPTGNSFRQDWTVGLSPNVPLELRVHSGASSVALDLSGLKVTYLNVDSGASAVDVTLPEAAGRTEAHVKAGVAGVHIRVPEGVAARIKTQNGLSGTSIDPYRFPKNGSDYQSPNYDTATNRVDLYVETGVSGLTID